MVDLGVELINAGHKVVVNGLACGVLVRFVLGLVDQTQERLELSRIR